jgi:hypothetical protein
MDSFTRSGGVFDSSVWFCGYLLWVLSAVACIFIDVRARHAKRHWVAAAIGGPIGAAAYLAMRPLRMNESREGGTAWQFLSKLVILWTSLILCVAMVNLAMPGAAMATLGLAWAGLAVPALVVGLALKRNSVEHGPTGVLGAMASWFPGPERTADGLNYICRECGKAYSVALPFCDSCGAWPGQSG